MMLLWMNGLVPVSYTHLDVYKRQVTKSTVSGGKVSTSRGGFGSSGSKGGS